MTNDIINVFAQGLVNTNAFCRLAWNPAYSASATQQPKGKLPATCIPEIHGSRTEVNYNRFPIKTLSSVLLLTALSNHFLLLLPLLSLVPLHLFFSTVTSATYFTLYFSQISPRFFPVSVHAYYWCHLCSISAPVLYNTAHSYSLCPSIPPFPLGAPTIHFHTVVTFSGPSTHQPAEIKCGFCSVLWKSSPWPHF